MKRIAILSLFIVFLNSCSYRPPKDHYLQQYSPLHNNVVNYFLSQPVNERKIKEILLDLSDEGFWPQIDYTSKQRGYWPPIRHLTNLLSLAQVCSERVIGAESLNGENIQGYYMETAQPLSI